MRVISDTLEFEWDKGNLHKSYQKHGISQTEAEEIFEDENILIISDVKHTQKEKRMLAVGKTVLGRTLFAVYVVRKGKVRIISIRPMHQGRWLNMKKLKKIPHFKNEEEENNFWQRVDSTEYVDWSKAEHWVFPNLKLSTKPITIRITESLLNRFKIKANKLDVPYQALMKQALAKGIMML